MAEGKIYRLKEMLESMETSLENAKKVYAQQGKLTKLVETSDNEKEFEDFVKESNDQLENLDKQIQTLGKRINLLKEVIDKAEVNQKMAHVVESLLSVLGVFEE